MVCKDPAKRYLYPNPEKYFEAFRRKGFNLIRFGIFWDGVEPGPGQYDMEYLPESMGFMSWWICIKIFLQENLLMERRTGRP